MANHDVSVAGWLTAGHTRKWALDIYPAIKADLVRLTRILNIMKHLHPHFVHLYVRALCACECVHVLVCTCVHACVILVTTGFRHDTKI